MGERQGGLTQNPLILSTYSDPFDLISLTPLISGGDGAAHGRPGGSFADIGDADGVQCATFRGDFQAAFLHELPDQCRGFGMLLC